MDQWISGSVDPRPAALLRTQLDQTHLFPTDRPNFFFPSGLPNLVFARMDFEGFIAAGGLGEFWSGCQVSGSGRGGWVNEIYRRYLEEKRNSFSSTYL